MNLEYLMISDDSSIQEAAKRMETNSKEFLIVVNCKRQVVGILTIGRLLSAFAKGKKEELAVASICERQFICVRDNDNIDKAVDLFDSESINILPVLDKNNLLVNVVTKKQMKILRLQEIEADLSYDFQSIDEQTLDYDIICRPWGFYKTTMINSYFQSKVISVKPKAQLSLQSHDFREEHWIVVRGRGTAQIEQSIVNLCRGSSIFIPKGGKHRLTNTDSEEVLTVVEVQIGNYFGEDDIHRFVDVYGRV